MADDAIDHKTLAKLVESGAVRAAHVISHAGGWGVIVTCGKTARPLAAQRGKARLFSRLETVAVYLRGIGIAHFDLMLTLLTTTRRARAGHGQTAPRR